jgi:hypothetical protein
MNADSLFLARIAAGMTRDDLATRAAAIGHRTIDEDGGADEVVGNLRASRAEIAGATGNAVEPRTIDEDGHECLRADLLRYVELAEDGELDGDDALPVLHPYIAWFAQALGISRLRLIDQPLPTSCSG